MSDFKNEPVKDHERSSRVRIMLEVVAGVIPNKPEKEFTKQFAITEEQWEDEEGIKVMQIYGFVQEYMRTLWNPNRVNWVQCNWIYL